MEINRPALTGLKKRQQIKNANKAVFVWVTVAAVIVAIAAVLLQSLIRQFFFNVKIIDATSKSNATIVQSIKNYDLLKQDVASKLLSNQELKRLRIDENDSALQTIIDAMPTVDDRVALATSLQQSILSKSGVVIESLTTDNAAGTLGTAVAAPTSGPIEIPFSIKVSGTYNQIKTLLSDMQHSIRPISIRNINITGGSSTLNAEIQAVTYYSSPKTTKLSEVKI